MDHSRPLFLYFRLFNTVGSEQFNINFANDGIRTSDPWCRKRLLCQLSHNHCPKAFLNKLFHTISTTIIKMSSSHLTRHKKSFSDHLKMREFFFALFGKRKNFREHFWSQWDMKRGKKDLFFKLSLDCGWQLQMPPEWNGEGLPSNKWTNNIFKKHLLKRLLMALPEPLFVYFRAFQTSLQFCNK